MSPLFRGIASLAIGLTFIASSPAAFAHAHLKHQSPAAERENITPPREMVLAFSEGIEPAFSGINITGPGQTRVKIGKARRSADDSRQLIVPLEEVLKPGTYQVEWHVVSVDGHKTQGHYQFIQK